MGASPDFMQGVLAQLGMGNPQPSPQGGIMGAINSALAPYGGAGGLGMALLANKSGATAPGAVLGQGMQSAQQNYLDDTLKKVQIAQGAAQLPALLYKQKAIADAFGQPSQPSPQPQQQPATGPSAVQAMQPPQAPPSGAPPTAAQSVPEASGSLYEQPVEYMGRQMGPQQYQAMLMAFGAKPDEAVKATRELQVSQAQMRVKPHLAVLDAAINSSANPAALIQANPEVRQAWLAGAQQNGFDPNDLSDINTVRQGLAAGRNAMATAAQLEPIKPPLQAKQIPGPLGQKLSQDPITGEIKQEVAPQETAQFITPEGPRMLTKAEGIAKGYAPFNPSIFGAANMTDQAIQMAADTYRTTGKFPSGMARNPIMQAKVLDRVAADAAAQGDSAGSIAARQAALKANGVALDQVTKLETATNGYAATLEKNLTNLEAAYKQAGNLGSPLLTRAQRFWQQNVTGDKDTAAMVTWLNAVQGEYAKLKSGNLGNAPASDAQMRDAKEVINKYMNEGGIAAVGQAMRQEAANRKAAIAEQKQSLMGSLSGNAPGRTPQGLPPTNAQGWVLHADKNGNRAYVSPDGKQFEEVK